MTFKKKLASLEENYFGLKISVVRYPFLLQVDIPKGAYNGQKLTKPVNTKIAARTSNTIPQVPEIIS